MAFHFSIDRQTLFRALSAQQNITGKKGTMAILSNVLMEVEHNKILFTGTDLEIGLKQEVAAEVFHPGALTLPAKKLFELVRESSSENLIFQEQANQWVEITAGSSVYRLAGMVAEEFPKFPGYDAGAMVEMESITLASLIDKTIFSIATDKENMFSLTSALLVPEEKEEKRFLKMITSDGHRLSIMTREVDQQISALHFNEQTLIPRKGILEIRKFCEDNDRFQFGIEAKQAVLKSAESLLIIRLMDGTFPDLIGILSTITNDNIIFIDRIRFLEALKRINLFTEDIFHAIRIDVQDSTLLLSSQNVDIGSAKDEFTVTYAGRPLSLAFNCRYFIEVLQVMEGNTVQAAIRAENSPCCITSQDDEGFLSIIMPMKL